MMKLVLMEIYIWILSTIFQTQEIFIKSDLILSHKANLNTTQKISIILRWPILKSLKIEHTNKNITSQNTRIWKL